VDAIERAIDWGDIEETGFFPNFCKLYQKTGFNTPS
jgi:hypothetical protein